MVSRWWRQHLASPRGQHAGHGLGLGQHEGRMSNGAPLWRCGHCGGIVPHWAVLEHHVRELLGVCPGPSSRALPPGPDEGTDR